MVHIMTVQIPNTSLEREIAEDIPTSLDAPLPDALPSNTVQSTEHFSQHLMHVTAYFLAELNPEALLDKITTTLGEQIPTIDACLLWLYDKSIGKLSLVSHYGLPLQAPIIETLLPIAIKPNESLIGQAYQKNKLLVHTGAISLYGSPISESPDSHKELLQEIANQKPSPITVTAIPLRLHEEIIGILHHINFSPSLVDTTSEQQTPVNYTEILQTFANIVAQAIKNAQRYEESQNHCRHLGAFDSVVTAISNATDLNNLMNSALEVVMGILPLLAGAIFLHDPATKLLNIATQQGVPDEYVVISRNMSVSGAPCEEVVYYGQAAIRPLMEERGEAILIAAGIESVAYLPLLVGGTVVGILALYGGSKLHKQIKLEHLMPLSHQVGFAIANVRLYEDSQLERRKLSTVINSIAEGVVLCDQKGRLVLANEAAIELLSLDTLPYHQTLSEMVDFYGIRDIEGGTLPVEQLPMARALSGEIFHDYRVLLRGASGSNSVMSFSGAPTISEGSNTIEGAVVVFRDITANQRLERAKDEFLAVAAHELRSPLAAVRGYTDLLLKREHQRHDADPRDIRGFTVLSQQITHMLRMVDNMLDVSRLDAGQLGLQIQPTNMVSIASQVLDQNKPFAGNREIILETEHPEIFVECDSMRIRQVLTNLVANATKYTPPATNITIKINIVETDSIQVKLNDEEYLTPHYPHKYELLVAVADQGNIIPPEQHERLFTRYYRAAGRRAEGLGLGLYLCRQFVLMHGGRIWVESVENQGNIFSFTLPMNDAQNAKDEREMGE